MTLKVRLFILLLFISSLASGQMDQYNFKRELRGVDGQWHKVILPNELFGKTSQDLHDIRIFGVTENQDTIEAPYLVRLTAGTTTSKEVSFKVFNTSHNQKGYYYTFEVADEVPVNQIKLDFAQENFDWRVTLEGSHDPKEWFSVVEDYRIMSIRNELTSYRFTRLTFPDSKYRYYRMLIVAREKPELIKVSMLQQEITEGMFREYPIKEFRSRDNRQSRQTEVDLEFKLPVRVSEIRVGVADTFDYYRPLTIKYLADSFKTETGWRFNYNTLTSGTLNSIEDNAFQINSTTVKTVKILIDNHDNQPLTIDSIDARGYLYELVVRVTEPATYYLVYGNNSASRPSYDIERFKENIPGTLTSLQIGAEAVIQKREKQSGSPLFVNKAWLWSIMVVVIVSLGWFSMKMLRKE